MQNSAKHASQHPAHAREEHKQLSGHFDIIGSQSAEEEETRGVVVHGSDYIQRPDLDSSAREMDNGGFLKRPQELRTQFTAPFTGCDVHFAV